MKEKKSRVFGMSDLVNGGATKRDSKKKKKECDVIIYTKELWTELGRANE